MTYKTLLVHVEASPDSNLRLRAAVDLAHELRATLIGVGGSEPIYLDNPMMMDGCVDGTLLQSLTDFDVANLKDAEARFHAAVGSRGGAAIWLSARDYPDLAMRICAAGADLIVASAQRGPKASTAAAADLVLRTGLPVLTIPTDLPAIRTKRIVVAWKNTREARRAVSDAMPLLIAADQVAVLRICSSQDQDAAHGGLNDVVGRLARQGVNATPKTLQCPTEKAFHTLATFAEEQLADLIVAGAYGHSRLGEWMLGGMSQDLFDQSTLPVLFSH